MICRPRYRCPAGTLPSFRHRQSVWRGTFKIHKGLKFRKLTDGPIHGYKNKARWKTDPPGFCCFHNTNLFMPQRFYRIGHSRTKRVETHRKQRKRQCDRTTQNKYPPRKIRAIGKAVQPTSHRKIRNRPGK